jgi:hypothetical protein
MRWLVREIPTDQLFRLGSYTYVVFTGPDQSEAGVLDKPYSQLTLLSGVVVQARQSTQARTVSIVHPM